MPKIRRRIVSLLLFLFILAFFITPLGYESKILLNRIFAATPEIVAPENRQAVDYDWQLKDENWDFFNLERSKGKVIFVSFWASWQVPSVSELRGIQQLYNDYKDTVDFYIISDEEREPVTELLQKRGYNFKVTYLIIGKKMPFDAKKVPSGYIIDKQGRVAAQRQGVTRWNSAKVRALLDALVND